MTIESDIQKNSPGKMVELFVLDATSLGGGVHRFIKGTDNGQAVVWQGQPYMPMDLEAEGFEVNGQGSLPRPKIRVTHANSALMGLVAEYRDLVGATLTRWRTLAQFLDGASEADPNSHFAPDIYKIDRKSQQNRVYIEWELAAAMDQEGKKIPGRQVLRDGCSHLYRVWSSTEHDYSKATCPYTAAVYFDMTGTPVADPASDRCGKRLSDCKLRHPNNQLMPFRGFPGVARVRP
ncbi:phage minor tail protein L [uncultured Pseudodesulfovibrio sp.]|uniref:phage minor tail protein L n=1 Tax=uncultured Pseudodesulfovibrio sp. TaxID=2035858 RepID=UPI0029C6EC35|nr:phage minor tail protein L [uncultured Pseudodesulfovibrio sp.]